MPRSLATIAVWMLTLPVMPHCRSADEAQAQAMCDKADALKERNPKAALALKRQLYEEMPTAGTAAAKACLVPVREKMGRVRVLVSEDKKGETATLDGCIWAADVMETFSSTPHPPFKKKWAKRLMAQCVTMVGRAWTRYPDDPHLRALSKRFRALSK